MLTFHMHIGRLCYDLFNAVFLNQVPRVMGFLLLPVEVWMIFSKKFAWNAGDDSEKRFYSFLCRSGIFFRCKILFVLFLLITSTLLFSIFFLLL